MRTWPYRCRNLYIWKFERQLDEPKVQDHPQIKCRPLHKNARSMIGRNGRCLSLSPIGTGTDIGVATASGARPADTAETINMHNMHNCPVSLDVRMIQYIERFNQIQFKMLRQNVWNKVASQKDFFWRQASCSFCSVWPANMVAVSRTPTTYCTLLLDRNSQK
jgi:hypothetical protein